MRSAILTTRILSPVGTDVSRSAAATGLGETEQPGTEREIAFPHRLQIHAKDNASGISHKLYVTSGHEKIRGVSHQKQVLSRQCGEMLKLRLSGRGNHKQMQAAKFARAAHVHNFHGATADLFTCGGPCEFAAESPVSPDTDLQRRRGVHEGTFRPSREPAKVNHKGRLHFFRIERLSRSLCVGGDTRKDPEETETGTEAEVLAN